MREAVQFAGQLRNDAVLDRHRAKPGEVAIEPRLFAGGEELFDHVLERHLAGRRRPAIRRPARGAPQRARDPLPALREFVAEVGGIAAEQLVGTFTGQNDFHVLAGGFRQQERGKHRGVPERLGECARHHLERATERCIVGRDDVMDAGDRMRHRFRIRALVVPALREPHRVGVNALARDAAGSGGDEKRRIESPAREDAERYVGHQLALHGTQQRVTHCRGVAECRPAAGRRRGAPERANLGSLAFRDEQ